MVLIASVPGHCLYFTLYMSIHFDTFFRLARVVII